MNFPEVIFQSKEPYHYLYLDEDQELHCFYYSPFEKSQEYFQIGNGNYLGFNDKSNIIYYNSNLIFQL